jgi:hypothetical protein
MPNTLIDFRGDHGTPYAVYEAELDAGGKVKILRTIFKPHPAQVEFFSATEHHVLLHGNRGCGKSASLLWKAIQTAYLVPGCRVAIYRKTWPELQRSIWDELLKLPQDLYQDLNASNHTVTIRAKDGDGTWKLSKIWFVTAQNVEDARKVLGFEVHTLLIDEWAEVEQEIWRFMSGSVRSPMSTDVAGRPASAQILGASTPGDRSQADPRGTSAPRGQDLRQRVPKAFSPCLPLGPQGAVSEGSRAATCSRGCLRSRPCG